MAELTAKELRQLALDTACISKCDKRKVGAVIADTNGKVLGVGCNYSPSGTCEDAAGATMSDVVHAEIAAIQAFKLAAKGLLVWQRPLTMYTTHAPCPNCRAAIEKAGIIKIIVVEDVFMKFDTDKLRYDLIPVSWTIGDAEIITFGAKKYKPDNWKEADDLGRYFAALERHLIACKLAWEKKDTSLLFDEETKLHHLKHLRTNAGFLLTLLEEKINVINNRSDN